MIVLLTTRPFIRLPDLPHQTVHVSLKGTRLDTWELSHSGDRRRALFVDPHLLDGSDTIELTLELPDATSPVSLGVNQDDRMLGLFIGAVEYYPVANRPPPEDLVWQYGRQVGQEARKMFDQRIDSGFWSRYITGPNVLDIGFRGGTGDGAEPITPTAIGVDIDYPGYDGRTLPFATGSQDTVFASHCLEHIPEHIKAIQEWHRVVKVGGHIIIAVPHAHLYERRYRPPSKWNQGHCRFYTSSSLLAEIEAALIPNTYRVRHLEENDSGYDYTRDPMLHPPGCYEIVAVVEKLDRPPWDVEV